MTADMFNYPTVSNNIITQAVALHRYRYAAQFAALETTKKHDVMNQRAYIKKSKLRKFKEGEKMFFRFRDSEGMVHLLNTPGTINECLPGEFYTIEFAEGTESKSTIAHALMIIPQNRLNVKIMS